MQRRRNLTIEMYYKDTPSFVESTLVEPKKWLETELRTAVASGTHHCESRFSHDWSHPCRYLLPEALHAKQIGNKGGAGEEERCLLGDKPNDARLEITHAVLFV